jgi:spermidine synthase
MEKFQYGQRLEFEILEILNNIKTDKSRIQYVKTSNHGNVLLMDEEVQLSTQDEYRYHEKLIHPAMSKIAVKPAARILILGGGDGCAAREVLKWTNVGSIDLVDYDSEFVETFGKGIFAELNNNSLHNSKVNCYYVDAVEYILKSNTIYDAIFIDFPDPDSEYFIELYQLVIRISKQIMHPNGVLGMHVGPVLLNEKHPTWETIGIFNNTLMRTFENLNPNIYFNTCYVPSFSNEWGFLHMVLNEKIFKNIVTDVAITDVEYRCKFWKSGSDKIDNDFQFIYARCLRVFLLRAPVIAAGFAPGNCMLERS